MTFDSRYQKEITQKKNEIQNTTMSQNPSMRCLNINSKETVVKAFIIIINNITKYITKRKIHHFIGRGISLIYINSAHYDTVQKYIEVPKCII